MVGTGRRQVIPHGVWTRLLEVDLELMHDFGHNVEFMVLNDRLYLCTPIRAELRSTIARES